MDVFLDRGNFIVSQKLDTAIKYEKAQVYSYVYANYKYLGCVYDQQIMDKLNKMMKKCKVV